MKDFLSHSSRGLTCVVLLQLLLCPGAMGAEQEGRFNVVEATIPEMQRAMEEGQITSRELVEAHLLRIALYEERVNAVIAVNANALVDADRLDQERARGSIRGPLHGIPVALKDNIHTMDMPTTGGAMAFRDFVPPYEATLVTNLRAAGAIILAKTVMTELANFTAAGMPGNYSAIGGYGLNPYDPRRDPREGRNDGRPVMNVGGSSSGIGTAMSFWAGNVGTETSGSILSPANANMLAAIKPTVGRVSRWGVIPITADQDTAGPMARTVTDVAILFGVLEGNSPDPNDLITSRCQAPPNGNYTVFLQTDGLRGARIGIPRAFYYEETDMPGSGEPRSRLTEGGRAIMAEAIAILQAQGAVIVDPANIPSVIDPDPENNLLVNSTSSVLSYGMKRDFNAWLASLGASAPVRSLTELREWNLAHETSGAIKYGQARLDGADERNLVDALDEYQADRARDLYLNAEHGIDEVMTNLQLDALLFPAVNGAGISAKPGYPTVLVPFATLSTQPDPPLPQDFEPRPRPFGVSFAGMACSETRLFELAYAFEQASLRRYPPAEFP
ncbi:MAG: amidase family protein [Gammaproteobacteria bacterium]|jgi:amidase|nr:amidase [Gammaproteobacteria bacterium]MDP6096750.1 amidase family protein [Gammaproteobacteria bacterium]HJO11845.1 amidase family protein [Gammaproteobacteria bacterium]|tara:strand:+ start:94 stop:1770 length:1677 start_codon:yes stop_codon:yes gene_type:complete